ncbi:MAG: sugar phosphate isomerase/epimerase family protein [Planctomycetota bacterium]
MRKHDERVPRREFLSRAGIAPLLAATPSLGFSPQESRPTAWKKAVKLGMVREKLPLSGKFRLLKELGFDGVELSSPNRLETREVLEARDAAGLPIHGVVDSVHWKVALSDPDPEVRRKGVEGLRTALRDAKSYGASTVLLVPAKVTASVRYDQAYERSQAEIRKVLPLAAELGVRIALENVWNNFLLSPLETARYIDEFESPWIGAYFDVGNVVKYGWPGHWIRILRKRILKVDIKEYSHRKRFDVPLLQGDCNWPAVMKSFAEIGYAGWATAEIRGGDRKRLAEIAGRMDRIFAS